MGGPCIWNSVRNVLFVVSATTVVGTTVSVLSTPFIVETLGSPAWWIAVIEVLGVVVLVSGAILGGPTIRQFGPARALLLAVLGASVGTALMGSVPRVEWLLPLELVTGVSAAIFQAVLPTISPCRPLITYSAAPRRHLALSVRLRICLRCRQLDLLRRGSARELHSR